MPGKREVYRCGKCSGDGNTADAFRRGDKKLDGQVYGVRSSAVCNAPNVECESEKQPHLAYDLRSLNFSLLSASSRPQPQSDPNIAHSASTMSGSHSRSLSRTSLEVPRKSIELVDPGAHECMSRPPQPPLHMG